MITAENFELVIIRSSVETPNQGLDKRLRCSCQGASSLPRDTENIFPELQCLCYGVKSNAKRDADSPPSSNGDPQAKDLRGGSK